MNILRVKYFVFVTGGGGDIFRNVELMCNPVILVCLFKPVPRFTTSYFVIFVYVQCVEERGSCSFFLILVGVCIISV